MTSNERPTDSPFPTYRTVAIGETSPRAVTVGIERSDAGAFKAAVWWEAVDDVDADEVEYDNVEQALLAAEAARALHGLDEVVVVLSSPDVWNAQWGVLN